MKTNEKLYNAGYRKIDKLKAEIKHLNTIVERLDELLAKGIDEYIMGIDGVEGLKDMWERSAVRAWAKKFEITCPPQSWMHIEDLGETK